MPSVASPALKPVPSPAPPPAAAPASNSAPVSPFDSLLDDGSQSAAPPQPASVKVPATQAPPPQPASAKAPPTQAPPTASAVPPTTDGGTQTNAVIMPAQPDMAVQTINMAGNPKPSDAQAVSEFKAAIEALAPDAGVPAQAGQSTGGAQGTDATAASGDQTPGGVQGTDGKVTLDAKAVV